MLTSRNFDDIRTAAGKSALLEEIAAERLPTFGGAIGGDIVSRITTFFLGLVGKPLLEVIAAADPQGSRAPVLPPLPSPCRAEALPSPSQAALSFSRKPAILTSTAADVEALRRELWPMRQELQVLQRQAVRHATPSRILSNLPTVGRAYASHCHRNTEQLWELKTLLGQPRPIEVQLVLSATTREAEAEEMIRQFRIIPYHSLLFAKPDESSTLGRVFNLTVRLGKPLSYLTTGQRVPEDFEVAIPERIVDLCWHGFWR